MQPATEAGHSSNERRAVRAGGRVLLELYELGHRRSGSTRLPRAARAPPLGRPRPPHQPGLVSPPFPLPLSLSTGCTKGDVRDGRCQGPQPFTHKPIKSSRTRHGQAFTAPMSLEALARFPAGVGVCAQVLVLRGDHGLVGWCVAHPRQPLPQGPPRPRLAAFRLQQPVRRQTTANATLFVDGPCLPHLRRVRWRRGGRRPLRI